MTVPEADSDEALMAAYVAGDPSAHRALVERYTPVLLGLIRRDLARAQDAEDLVQETFLHLHRARHDFRQGARLRPWLMTIALNLKREYFRRLGRRRERPADLSGPKEPSYEPRTTERRETRAQVRQAMTELTNLQREVIELHWFGGLSFPDIAKTLDASVSAVKVRAHRGYERLRELLAEIEEKP